MSTFESSEAWNVAMDLLDQPGADERLREAVRMAVDTENSALEAEARMALGILLQHRGKPAEARPELESALAMEDAAPADRACGESYLKAIVLGYEDGSFMETALVGRSIRDYVLSRLPQGVVENLSVSIDETGHVRANVEVERDLSDAETAMVNSAIDEAIRAHDASGQMA